MFIILNVGYFQYWLLSKVTCALLPQETYGVIRINKTRKTYITCSFFIIESSITIFAWRVILNYAYSPFKFSLAPTKVRVSRKITLKVIKGD